MWNPINGIDKNSVSHLKMGRGKKRDSIFTVGLSKQNAPTIKIGASERKYITNYIKKCGKRVIISENGSC